MKMMKSQRSKSTSLCEWKRLFQVPVLALLGVLAGNASGQQLTWAPNGTGPSDGGGTWLAGNNWWNGSSSTIVSGTWAGTATDGATFGSGTAGAYPVDLGGNNILLTNLVFNTSGYTLQNGALTFSAPAGDAAAYNFVTLGANVAATISAAITNSYSVANASMTVGSGSTLTLTGGGGFAGNTITTGAGTVDFNSGTYGGYNGGSSFVLWTEANTTQEAATLNLGRLLVGYSGNSTLTINSASAQMNDNGSGGNNLIGRSGSTGVVDLVQGTVTMTHSGNDMRIAYDANSKGTLTVQGGTFNMGTVNTIYVNYGGTGAPGAGTLNISGGTVTTEGVSLGSAGTYTAGSTATVNMTGGTLYLGASGFNVNSGVLGNLTTSVLLSGGIIGATTAWTGNANATLGTTGGNITFQTADATAAGHNITWNGALSGLGGLTETGAGLLTLGGLNTYTGNTTVNGTMDLASAGQLTFKIGANGVNNQVNGTGSLTLDGLLNINLTGADDTQGDSWTLFANGLHVTYDPTFNINGFTQDGTDWTDGDYQFNELTGVLSVPEPSAVAMMVGGMGMLLAFGRHFRKKV